MPEYVIVKYHDNWADEFDVDTIWVVSKTRFDKWASLVTEKINEEQEVYFGTNEYITVESGAEVVAKCKVTPIPEDEAKVLAKWLGTGVSSLRGEGLEYGQVSIFSYLQDIANREG